MDGIDCEQYRIDISARLDGESTSADAGGADTAALALHLAGCGACRRFESEAIALARAVRVVAAEPAPDLSQAIMAAVNRERVGAGRRPAGRPAPKGRLDPKALRVGLVALAAVQMLLAVPVLLLGHDSGAPVHIAREIGSFDFALAVGFGFVGWRPVRAYGMLPLVAALVACLGTTTAVDLLRGTATVLGESSHLLNLMGLASVWELARMDAPPKRGGHRGRSRLTPVNE